MSSATQNSVADPQEIIADLRRQLDERTAGLDEAQAREVAIAEVLAVINASPGDLAPVFDAMVEKAMQLCEADYGHVLTFDGQQFHITGIDAMTPRAFLARAGGPHLDAGGAIENADVELRDRNPVVPEP